MEPSERFRCPPSWSGNPEALSDEERGTVDAVCETNGDKSAQWLSDLTHMEAPGARRGKGWRPGSAGTGRSAEVRR